jgi:hypothetical protein
MVKVKSKVTGATSLITKSAFAQGKKYFTFISEVQADKDGNEILPKQAAPAPEASPKLNPQEQNQSQNEEEKVADPVVVSDPVVGKKKPGPKPKTSAE